MEGFAGGTEDFAPWYAERGLFISSPDFRHPTKPGHLYWLSFAYNAEPVDITPSDLDFHLQPHGIDLWVGEDGAARLFVINHRSGSALPEVVQGGAQQRRDTVELFDVSPPKEDGGAPTLTHVKTVADDPLIKSPNDVAALTKETFWVSNDHGWADGIWRHLEDYGRIPVGDVIFWDGERFRVSVEGLRYANGLATDGEVLWIAQTTGMSIARYPIEDPTTGAVGTPPKTWPTNSGVDNLTIAQDGTLWTGGHPKLLAFVAHSKNPTEARSPSQVLRLNPERPGSLALREYYLNRGDPISGSSAALYWKERIFIGAVFDPIVLRCRGAK